MNDRSGASSASPVAPDLAHPDRSRYVPFVKRHPHTVNELDQQESTPGQRAADRVAAVIGSWRFIIFQTSVLVAWLTLNTIGWINHWDPYPFILLNLVVGFQSAYSAPIIMMSQNRQSAKDRLAAEEDYRINAEAELQIVGLHARLDHLTREQWDELMGLQRRQIEILEQLAKSREK